MHASFNKKAAQKDLIGHTKHKYNSLCNFERNYFSIYITINVNQSDVVR